MASTRPLPTGTLTLLFTDIEGSTRLVQSLGAARYAELQAEHHRLMRAAFAAHGGHEVDTQGDAFFAVFTHAVAAVAAAIDAQRALASHPWPEGGAVRVRMGLHTGEPVRTDEGYVGLAVNRGARVCGAAHGGQIYLSSTCRQIVAAGDPSPDWTFRDLGEHPLEGIHHPEHLFQVLAPGMPDVATPPATAPQPRDLFAAREGAARREMPEASTRLLQAIRREGDEATAGALTPADLQAVVDHPAADLTTYRLGRVAEWSLPRYQLDKRFVSLTLIVDPNETTYEQHHGLHSLLASTREPAVVVTGPPGSGKSSVLRHCELDTAMEALRRPDSPGPLTFFIELSRFAPERPGMPPPAPLDWLALRWQARYPGLPRLTDLLRDGRMILLLDALNEMPTAGLGEYWAWVRLWRAFLLQAVQEMPGNRVVFTCRTRDYSEHLSAPTLTVPVARIEPLSNPQMQQFLQRYTADHADAIWAELNGTPHQSLLRTPFLLKLLVDQVHDAGAVPRGRAALFTGFVRQALRREVQAGHRLFQPDGILTERDCARIAQARRWRTPSDLPEQGPLIRAHAKLAYEMQRSVHSGQELQVRMAYDHALGTLDHPLAEPLVRAGVALGILDEDPERDDVRFIHQLFQEYFAARHLAGAPDGGLARVEWRAAAVQPGLVEVIQAMSPTAALSLLPTTGWEETFELAAEMVDDVEGYLRDVEAANLALAGRCASQPGVRERLGQAGLDALRWSLVRRSRDPEADLRDRIAVGLALGWLGDPRVEPREGPLGAYLAPPLVEVPGGRHAAGRGDPAVGEVEAGWVETRAFAIGRFPVTNAEWACFMAGGGYDDERWWDTPAARDWRRGVDTSFAMRADDRRWRDLHRADPELIERQYRAGQYTEAQYEKRRRQLAMDDAAFEVYLDGEHPDMPLREPRYWLDEAFNNPAQPVVGVSWFEARAYGRWLSAQTGQPFRLPTEVEWRVAAGDLRPRGAPPIEALALIGNVQELRLKRTTPIGIFPIGDTPSGISDLTGNMCDWTGSVDRLGEREPIATSAGRPEDDAGGAEMAPAGVERVCYGTTWGHRLLDDPMSTRLGVLPGMRGRNIGFRLVRVPCPSHPGDGV